jgi:bacterioferritin-associated ferredoxin
MFWRPASRIGRRNPMIVCSCNLITRRDIEEVIESILADDPYAVLTPGLVYHRLGKRGKCGGCFPNVVRILVEHGDRVRERITGEEPAGAQDDDADAETIYRRAVAGWW